MPAYSPAPPRASYREIGGPDGHLAHRRPFRGNSMSAHFDAAGVYVVKSYSTIIAHVGSGDHIWVTDQHYSVTTTRHQNLCRAWL